METVIMETVIQLRVGVVEAYCDFAFVDTNESRLVMASVFKRGTDLRGFTSLAQDCPIFGFAQPVRRVCTDNYFTVQNSGAELVSHAFMKYKKEKGIQCPDYLISSKEYADQSVFDYLMNHFDLPLLKEWTPQILAEAEREQKVSRDDISLFRSDGGTSTIPMYGKEIPLEDIVIFKMDIDPEWLDQTVSKLLRSKEICITEDEQKPLLALREEGANVDTYFGEYGQTVKDNLGNCLEPGIEFAPVVEHIALKAKKPFPQQANAIAGTTKYLYNNPFVIYNMGMGCGKTFCSIATIENFYVTKWLRRNPGKTIKDAYLDPKAINYRTIVTCPGHLVEKWKEEIEEVIPYSKVKILRKFEDVTAIKKAGYTRNGKEFYIMSKDFMKLESTYRPVPWKVAERDLPGWECMGCGNKIKNLEVPITQHNPITQHKCECGSRRFKRMATDVIKKGLICPECGEILLSKNIEGLFPIDFSSKKTTNYKCCHCGGKLWVHNVSNLNDTKSHKKKKKWQLVSHFANLRKKERTTSWVLEGYEYSLYAEKKININEVEKTAEKKMRKVAPADYIHRQLKGWFDFCIHDELHLYKSGGSAQGIAMHQITKSSKKTIGLTGTIAGGFSEDLFYLLYRLDPQRMKSNGFSYNKVSEFSDVYGTRETVYSGVSDDAMNKSSRGTQRSTKKTKPGISPLIFGDFLIDRCVFLDITDMGKYIPDLKEEIVLCDTNDLVMQAYNDVLYTLKSKGGHGITPLTSIQLQFSLSYLDKPYGVEPIIHPKTGEVVVEPQSYYLGEDELLPKEEKIVELINKEQAEGRNVFVYCEYTNSENTKVTNRLKEVIEKGCDLKGKVAILESSKPKPSERAAWLKKQAIAGKRVIIANPKCVETGLDFIFKEGQVTYTYPTLIFYQMGYVLSTLWQASRRHYRLNQTKECRTFYLAYKGTVQQTVLSTMAEKQVATSAIQGGKFSAEGLSAMANGVDSRLKLIQAMNEGIDEKEGEKLQNTFKNLNTKREDFEDYDTSAALDFYELTGLTDASYTESKEDNSINASLFDILNISSNLGSSKPTIVVDSTATEIKEEEEPKAEVKDKVKSETKEKVNAQNDPVFDGAIICTIENNKVKKIKKKCHEKQMSIFDMLA